MRSHVQVVLANGVGYGMFCLANGLDNGLAWVLFGLAYGLDKSLAWESVRSGQWFGQRLFSPTKVSLIWQRVVEV